MATNKQGDLICVQCSNLLSGRQTLYCSDKCRKTYKRTRTNPDGRTTVRTDKPGQTREGTRTRGHERGQPGQNWRDQYHEIKGERDTIKDERDRLLKELDELRKQNLNLSAALIETSKFEGAYLALVEGQGDIEQAQEGETVQGDVVEVEEKIEREQTEQGGTLWWVWLTGRIKKR